MDAMGGQDQQGWGDLLNAAIASLQAQAPSPQSDAPFVQQAFGGNPLSQGGQVSQQDGSQAFIQALAANPEFAALLMPPPSSTMQPFSPPSSATPPGMVGKPMSDSERMGSPSPYLPPISAIPTNAPQQQQPAGLGLGFGQSVGSNGLPIYGPGGPGGAARNMGSGALANALSGNIAPTYEGGRIPQGWIRAADGGQAAWLTDEKTGGIHMQQQADLERERLAEKAARDAKVAPVAVASAGGAVGGGGARPAVPAPPGEKVDAARYKEQAEGSYALVSDIYKFYQGANPAAADSIRGLGAQAQSLAGKANPTPADRDQLNQIMTAIQRVYDSYQRDRGNPDAYPSGSLPQGGGANLPPVLAAASGQGEPITPPFMPPARDFVGDYAPVSASQVAANPLPSVTAAPVTAGGILPGGPQSPTVGMQNFAAPTPQSQAEFINDPLQRARASQALGVSDTPQAANQINLYLERDYRQRFGR